MAVCKLFFLEVKHLLGHLKERPQAGAAAGEMLRACPRSISPALITLNPRQKSTKMHHRAHANCSVLRSSLACLPACLCYQTGHHTEQEMERPLK